MLFCIPITARTHASDSQVNRNKLTTGTAFSQHSIKYESWTRCWHLSTPGFVFLFCLLMLIPSFSPSVVQGLSKCLRDHPLRFGAITTSPEGGEFWIFIPNFVDCFRALFVQDFSNSFCCHQLVRALFVSQQGPDRQVWGQAPILEGVG